jgi:multidrug resistance efflux pump
LDLEEAGMHLEYGRIRTPIDGIVARRRCHQGERVRPDVAGDSETIFTIMGT